jgi:hypothetical protein
MPGSCSERFSFAGKFPTNCRLTAASRRNCELEPLVVNPAGSSEQRNDADTEKDEKTKSS